MIVVLKYGSLRGGEVKASHWTLSEFKRANFAFCTSLLNLESVEIIAQEGEMFGAPRIVAEMRDVILPSGATVSEFGVTRL